MKRNDQAYAQIARSCLNVLNNVNPAMNREQQIEAVYAAIDAAVADIYKKQEQDLANAYGVLHQIAELQDTNASLTDAVKLAKDFLPTRH